jgi:EmrB/QacA subfamily drug resistance transporter
MPAQATTWVAWLNVEDTQAHGRNSDEQGFGLGLEARGLRVGSPLMTNEAAGTTERRWPELTVLVVSQFMVVLDTAIVIVALPSIKTALQFSQEDLQWVITGYAICFGGVLLLGGRLADLLGRRRVFIAGISLFTVFSLLDGLAWSEASLIVFRCMQGLGAGLISPSALSILTTTFTEGRERNRALGIWAAASASGGAAGGLLGGALTSGLGWSWIFFVNVPVGALVVAASPRILKESRAAPSGRHFDFAGAVAITSGLMLLVYAMTRATQQGWGSPTTIGLMVASSLLIASFFVIEQRSKFALLPLRILRLRTLAASNVSGLIQGAVIVSEFLLLTLYMQQVLHYSPIKTGVVYIPLQLTIILFSSVTEALVTRVGVKKVLPAGLALSAVAFVLFARLPVGGQFHTDLLPAFFISGLGVAVVFVSMNIGALTGVRPADAGVASGLINMNFQIGGAIGVAAAVTIATTATTAYVNTDPRISAVSGAALTHGYDIAFWVLAGIAATGAMLAALMLESQRAAEPEPGRSRCAGTVLGNVTATFAGETCATSASGLGIDDRSHVSASISRPQPPLVPMVTR